MNFSEAGRQGIFRFFQRLCLQVLGSVKYQPWGPLRNNNMSKYGTGYTKIQQSLPGVDCVAFPSRGGIYLPRTITASTIVAFLQRYFGDTNIVSLSDPQQCKVTIIRMPQQGYPTSTSIEIRFETDHWGVPSQFLINVSPTGILSLNASPDVSDTE